MHLVHTSFTSENNMGKILSLTSIFDIKMMVKSSAIEKKLSPTRRFRAIGLTVQYKKNLQKGRIGILIRHL